jgi:hypothetical protein
MLDFCIKKNNINDNNMIKPFGNMGKTYQLVSNP